MNKSIIAILTGLLMLMPLAAQAGSLQNRINNQEYRTYRGVKNGSISPKEYRQLERREDKIEAARLRAIRERVTFAISTNTQATFRGLPIKPFK